MIKMKKLLTERYFTFTELKLWEMPDIAGDSIHLEQLDINRIDEFSKNDLMPDLIKKKDHLVVFLFGPPATGKSTFVKKFLLPKMGAVKVINPDDIDAIRRKVKKVDSKFLPDTKELSVKYVNNIFKSGQNVVYDTTGNDTKAITDLADSAEENGYEYVFIHLIAPKKQGDIANKMRDRNVDQDYLEHSYEATQSLIKYYWHLNPLKYYIVTNIDNNYSFFEYNGKKVEKI